MRRWFVGRMMKRELVKTIRSAQKEIPYEVQKAIARHVLEKMSFVDKRLEENG